MTIYGYARVSTVGQSTDEQVSQLRANGADEIFREKHTGTPRHRPVFDEVLDLLQTGDT